MVDKNFGHFVTRVAHDSRAHRIPEGFVEAINDAEIRVKVDRVKHGDILQPMIADAWPGVEYRVAKRDKDMRVDRVRAIDRAYSDHLL